MMNMKTASQIAFERLQTLPRKWSESRHATRDVITGTIAINVIVVIWSGSKEEVSRIKDAFDSFEIGLKKQVAEYIELHLQDKSSCKILH
jgi:hypothetical protein